MIKVTGLNKYYNKGKDNELHVISNVSIEFPDKGFVTILGKSGSGKTTLLNAIGGLDNFENGTITYNLTSFSKYSMKQVDTYRNKNIGYIFQNYLVLPEESVFENVDTGLKLCGIYDKDERKKRANEALKAVGMLRYRRKLAGNLSGGQKQRVGIARALAKMPKIIIADEPTGNLDSENSVEIMRILKDISLKYLVIMVTHNEKLAWAFGDRIIYYKDGSIIKDIINTPEERSKIDLGRPKAEENKIYLSDYEKCSSNANDVSTTVYVQKGSTINLNIKIIERDNTKYLFIDDDNVIVNDKSIEVINERPTIDDTPEDEIRTSTFDNSSFTKLHRKPVSFFSLMKQAFFNFFHEKKMKTTAFKVLSGLMGAAIAVVGILTYYTFFTIDYSKALDTLETNSLSVSYLNEKAEASKSRIENSIGIAQILNNSEESAVDGIVTSITVNSSSFGLGGLTGKSSSYASAYIHTPQMNGENPNVSYGTNPEEFNEIAISSGLIDLAMPEYLNRGYSYDSLIGGLFYRQDGSRIKTHSTDVSPIISGIVKNSLPCIYLSKEGAAALYDGFISHPNTTYALVNSVDFKLKTTETTTDCPETTYNDSAINLYVSSGALPLFNDDFANDYSDMFNILGSFESSEKVALFVNNDDAIRYHEYESYSDRYISLVEYHCVIPSDLTISEGRKPINAGELLVSSNYSGELNEVIVGKYTASDLNMGNVYTVFNTALKDNFSSITNLSSNFLGNISKNYLNKYGLAFYSSDYSKTEKFLNYRDGEKAYDFILTSTKSAITDANNANLANNENIILLSSCGAILILMFILVLISTRSNMIRHIYTISVFRSLGTSKKDVHRIFISKDLVNYLLTIFLGVFIVFIVGWIFTGAFGLYGIPFWVFLLAVIFSYGVSLLGTMVPLWSLLKRTPTEISTKYDI